MVTSSLQTLYLKLLDIFSKFETLQIAKNETTQIMIRADIDAVHLLSLELLEVPRFSHCICLGSGAS